MNHTIVHFEIPAGDIKKLKEFYEGLFGWKYIYAPIPGMDYWLIHTVPTDEEGMLIEPGVNGGMYQKESDFQKPTNWISVPNIDQFILKRKDLGSEIIIIINPSKTQKPFYKIPTFRKA